MDSGISLNGDTISSPDSDNSSQLHLQNQSDIETKKSRRGHVLGELLETERIYVAEMGSILKVRNFDSFVFRIYFHDFNLQIVETQSETKKRRK